MFLEYLLSCHLTALVCYIWSTCTCFLALGTDLPLVGITVVCLLAVNPIFPVISEPGNAYMRYLITSSSTCYEETESEVSQHMQIS